MIKPFQDSTKIHLPNYPTTIPYGDDAIPIFVVGLPPDPIMLKIYRLYFLDSLLSDNTEWDQVTSLTWFMNMMNLSWVNCIENSKACLNALGYKVVVCTYAEFKTKKVARTYPELIQLTKQASVRYDPGVFWPITSITTLLIGKRLIAESAETWVANRVRAVLGKLDGGLDRTDEVLEYMNHDRLRVVSDFVTRCQPLQGAVTVALMQVRKYQDKAGTCALWVLELLKYAYMNYMTIMWNQLTLRAHPVMAMPSLSDEVGKLAIAYEYLASLGEAAYYAKLLYTDEQNRPINRNNFKLLIPIAVEIGRIYQPTLSAYKMDTTAPGLQDLIEFAMEVGKELSRDPVSTQSAETQIKLNIPSNDQTTRILKKARANITGSQGYITRGAENVDSREHY